MSSICINYVERSKDKPLHEMACPNFWLAVYIHSSICVVVSARILPVESSVGTDTRYWYGYGCVPISHVSLFFLQQLPGHLSSSRSLTLLSPLSLHHLQRDGIIAKVSSAFHSFLPEMLSGRVEEVTLPRQPCDLAYRRLLTRISPRRSSRAPRVVPPPPQNHPTPRPVADAKSVRLHDSGHESNKRRHLSAGWRHAGGEERHRLQLNHPALWEPLMALATELSKSVKQFAWCSEVAAIQKKIHRSILSFRKNCM